MKCLVTGVTGFVGSNLARKLNEDGHEVRIAKREFYEEDVVKNLDVLFHLAADVGRDNMFINYEAPLILFRKVIESGCKKIVYASSTAVYGNSPAPLKEGFGETPLNNYGRAKLLLDNESMKLRGATIVGLRFCNIYGGESDVIHKISQQDVPALYSFGKQKRDYIHIDDVMRALSLASVAKESCVLNCSEGKAISFNEICRLMGKSPKYIGESPEDFQTNTECDISLAKKKIGFSPKVSLVEVLKKISR